MTSEPSRGKVQKVVLVDEVGKAVAATEATSQQIADDFTYSHGIQEPPYAPEELIFLAESHPTHGAALEQRVGDVIGTGWEWTKPEEEDANETTRDALESWLQEIGDDPEQDVTFHETIVAAWDDLETDGWGMIEVARNLAGDVVQLYPIPAHTTRFHRDGLRVVQMRAQKRVWFKRWIPGDQREVNKVTGAVAQDGGLPEEQRANEVIVFKRHSRRSSWYGIPPYISALGWIMLSIAGRDDNLFFFNNRREPRWAIILSNLDEDNADVDEDLRKAFTVDLKQPHRNIIIPITGPGKVDFQSMSGNVINDMSFENLQARADTAILMSHRMPAERIGLAKAGPLGGDITVATTRVYKEGVVLPAQELLAVRMNRFVLFEGPFKETADNGGWVWRPKELDLTEEHEDFDVTVEAFKNDLLRLNEARMRIKMPPLLLDDGTSDPKGEMFFSEIAGAMPNGGATALRKIDTELRALLRK